VQNGRCGRLLLDRRTKYIGQPRVLDSNHGLLGLGGGGGSASVPAQQLPLVLFIWGPWRAVPVNVTSVSVVEQEFDPLLNPVKAAVTVLVLNLKANVCRMHFDALEIADLLWVTGPAVVAAQAIDGEVTWAAQGGSL